MKTRVSFVFVLFMMIVLVTTPFISAAQTSIQNEQNNTNNKQCSCKAESSVNDFLSKTINLNSSKNKNTVSSKTITDVQKVNQALAKLKGAQLIKKLKTNSDLSKLKINFDQALVKETDISQLDLKNKLADKNTSVATVVKVPLQENGEDVGQIIYTYTDKLSTASYSVKITGNEVEQRKKKLLQQQEYTQLIQIATNQNLKLDINNTIGLKSVALSSENDEGNVNFGIVIPIKDKFGSYVGKLMKFDSRDLPIMQLKDKVYTYKDGKLLTTAAASCSVYVGCVINCFCSGSNTSNCVMQILGCVSACCACESWLACIYCASCFYNYYYCALIVC